MSVGAIIGEFIKSTVGTVKSSLRELLPTLPITEIITSIKKFI